MIDEKIKKYKEIVRAEKKEAEKIIKDEIGRFLKKNHDSSSKTSDRQDVARRNLNLCRIIEDLIKQLEVVHENLHELAEYAEMDIDDDGTVVF